MDPYDYTTRPRTVRVSLDATATRPPGRKRDWTVQAGHEGYWRADGPNEKGAADALAARLATFLTEYRPPVVLSFRGHVAVIWADLGDEHNPMTWTHEIRRPDGYAYHSGGGESWADAEARTRHSLAQITTDWHDDVSVQEGAAFLAGLEKINYGQYGPDKFYEYAAWQRAAKAAIDAGLGDGYHQWAGDHAREYRVPRPGEQAPDTGTPADPNPWLADA